MTKVCLSRFRKVFLGSFFERPAARWRHCPLLFVDVLLRSCLHKVALTTDVSRMYRAVVLPAHRDCSRGEDDQKKTLQDYRMTWITFGVASSSFTANMAVRQNANEHAWEFVIAASAVLESFYVDDGLVGADSVEGAIKLKTCWR